MHVRAVTKATFTPTTSTEDTPGVMPYLGDHVHYVFAPEFLNRSSKPYRCIFRPRRFRSIEEIRLVFAKSSEVYVSCSKTSHHHNW
jgi:hypothetical protein